MKRLTAQWTIALATATLLAVPAANAQSPQNPPEPQPQQSTTLSTPAGQNASAAEHLRQAKEAYKSIDAATVPANAKSEFAALGRHINALERSIAANNSATGTTSRSPKATRDSANWASDVAAIDGIITQLAGATSTTGTSQPGTAGTTGTEPKTTTSSKPATAVTLDDAARTHLMEVRTHITAFAAAMSGTSGTPSTAASATSPSSTASPTEPSEPATPSPTTSSQPAPSSPTEQTTPSTTGQSPASPSQPSSAAGQSSTMTPGQATPSTTAQAGVDAAAAKQHLTSARESLTQLTQLPAAAQLQGDARTQVSQLIQNFNELITTQASWREAYAKVDANVTALIGPAAPTMTETSTTPPAAAPETAPANPPAAPANPPANPEGGTPGAVGTSGTVGAGATLDPGIRQKLVEFRTHLTAFHKAAGGEQPQ